MHARIFHDFVVAVFEVILRPDVARDRERAGGRGRASKRARVRVERENARKERNAELLADLVIRQAQRRPGE
jgi:hypothetical protein